MTQNMKLEEQRQQQQEKLKLESKLEREAREIHELTNRARETLSELLQVK